MGWVVGVWLVGLGRALGEQSVGYEDASVCVWQKGGWHSDADDGDRTHTQPSHLPTLQPTHPSQQPNRLDPVIQALDGELLNAKTEADAARLKQQIKEREDALLPLYLQVCICKYRAVWGLIDGATAGDEKREGRAHGTALIPASHIHPQPTSYRWPTSSPTCTTAPAA